MSVIPRKHLSSVSPGGPASPTAAARAQENLLLLTHDESLMEALASVVPTGCLRVVADESELVSQLLNGLAGVVFIDESATHSRPGSTAQLIQRLREQLPGTVLVVAGDGAAQHELAALVADGSIYRFVHKPVSAQRVKLFVDAAFRKREGNSASGIYPTLSMSQTAPVLAITPSRRPLPPLPWLGIAGGVGLLIAAAAILGLRSMIAVNPTPTRRIASAVIARPPPVAAPTTPASPSSAASGPLSASTGAPADFDGVATAAEQALLAGNLNEAARLTDAARAINPDHVRVKFLTTQIARDRAAANERRRAAYEQMTTLSRNAPTPVASALTNSGPVPANSAPSPVATSSPATVSGPVIAGSPAVTSPPTSAPPVSEAHDRNSVAAIVLERVYSVDPDFPEIAREHDLKGFVDLEFLVRPDGTVTDVTVLKASPIGVFERSAMAAVRQWRYRPISRDGMPVSQHARIRLNFAYK